MPSSVILCPVIVLATEVLQELIASIIRVAKIKDLADMFLGNICS
jgi:hypothetical protein